MFTIFKRHFLAFFLFPILEAACFLALFGCGVKGDPQPPDLPPPLGNGEIVQPQQPKYPKRLKKYDYRKYD